MKDENVIWHQHAISKQDRLSRRIINLVYFGLLDYQGQVKALLQAR